MPDIDDQVAAIETQMESLRVERDAANETFRQQLRALRGQIKVLRAEAALAEAQAEIAANTPEEG